MTEKNMQTLFSQHVKQFPPFYSEAYELKICKGTSMAFDHVQPHQIEALTKAEDESFFFKIPDQPISWGSNTQIRFAAKKPFDCFVLVNVKSYVILWFYKERQPKVFIKIPIQAFLKEKAESTRKSITEARALEIGEKIYINKHG